MSGSDELSLTIGDVAARTGVSVATLRAWEARHQFPMPERLSSGHRRYRIRDVAMIEQVARQRANGVTFAAALAGLRRDAAPARSIFAGLALLHSDLPRHVLSKRVMWGISRAIEDQCFASGNGSVLIGSFQLERFYRQEEHRWSDLARTAAAAVVLADFETTSSLGSGLVEVAVPSQSSLIREWAVICDGPATSAVLTGWELPGRARTGDHQRRFEATWSTDPVVVRDAVRVALTIATSHGLDGAGAISEQMPPSVDDPVVAFQRATILMNRIVSYFS